MSMWVYEVWACVTAHMLECVYVQMGEHECENAQVCMCREELEL